MVIFLCKLGWDLWDGSRGDSQDPGDCGGFGPTFGWGLYAPRNIDSPIKSAASGPLFHTIK